MIDPPSFLIKNFLGKPKANTDQSTVIFSNYVWEGDKE